MTGDLAQILRVPAVSAAAGEQAEPLPLTLYELVQKAKDQWLEPHEYYQLLRDLVDDKNGEHWGKAATGGPQPDGCWLRLISFVDYNNFRTGKSDGHVWMAETEKSLKAGQKKVVLKECYAARNKEGTLQRRCYWLLNHGAVDEVATQDKKPQPSDLALAHYLPLPAQPPPSPGALPPGTPAAAAGGSGPAPATTRKKAQPAPAVALRLDALVDALQEKSLDELSRDSTPRDAEAAEVEAPKKAAASKLAVADEEAADAATAALAGLKLEGGEEAGAAKGKAANAAKGAAKSIAKKAPPPPLPPSTGGGVKTRGRVEREAEAEAAEVLAHMDSIKEEHDRAAAAEADGALSDMSSMRAALDATAAEGQDLEQAAGKGAGSGGEGDQDDTAASGLAK